MGGSAITYYKCKGVFFSTVISISRHRRRAKRVPRAPPPGTELCCEFLLFCKNRLKNEKKNRFIFKIFRFSGSAITYYKCLRGFFFRQLFRYRATDVEPNEYHEHHRLVLNYAANFCFSAKTASKMKKKIDLFSNFSDFQDLLSHTINV